MWETVPGRGTHSRGGPMLFDGSASIWYHKSPLETERKECRTVGRTMLITTELLLYLVIFQYTPSKSVTDKCSVFIKGDLSLFA